MHIHIVTDVAPALLQRQEPNGTPHRWTYGPEPMPADAYAVYGVVRALAFPTASTPRIFIAVEPPEIFEYDTRALAQYDAVLAGDFPYLRSLPQSVVVSGLLNWHVGVDFSETPARERLSLAALDIASLRPRTNRVSVITSGKVMTPMQRQRREFIEYLQRHLTELDVFGRDTRPVADKAEALLPSRFHIALENNHHGWFWTEKLADPVLCRCHTFYSGAKPIDNDFDSHGITALDLTDFDAAYGRIAARLERGWTEVDDVAASANRTFITERANPHARIAAALAKQGPAHRGRSANIREHRVSVTERLRFLRERLRTVIPGQ